ncbi:hypothetical protein DFH09DRAFT_1074039 [Mycena vulgaris]|nr:hypothetical protein DFH09DRAFT_1074039 [Mycena vulgaris]
MATFDRSEGISREKTWKDVPKSVRQICHNDFTIPQPLASQILPADGLSIHALVDFMLPRATSTTPDAPDISAYFSKYTPDTVNSSMILRLRHLDMPPVKVIRQLVHDGKQAWLDGFTSVKYAHLPGDVSTHFPLWNAEIRKSATEVTKLLGILPWNGSKRGLSDSSPIHSLWRFLGTEWLSSTDENDMLEFLRARIASDPDLAGCVRVEAVELTAKLTAAFEHRESDNYQDPVWLRSLGTDVFQHGERLVTIAHLGIHDGNKHWVAIDVDGPRRMFRCGDSFSKALPPTLRQAYDWWASQHTLDALQFDILPTSTQTDGHSCGMLSGNAAERAVYPTIPLMEQKNIILERLRMFSKLANRILDRIADDEEEELQQSSQQPDFESEPEPAGTATPPPSFTRLAQSAEFTARRATQTVASPEKKRIREQSRERSPPPPLEFSPRHLAVVGEGADSAPAPTIGPSDVFGSIGTGQTQDSSDSVREEREVKQTKLGSFFKVATREEKEEMWARDAEVYRDTREARVAREAQEKYEATLRKKEATQERKQRSRANIRADKIANGWEPEPRGRKHKTIELENFDRGPSASSSKLAEDSRPRRQFREDLREDNKPQGQLVSLNGNFFVDLSTSVRPEGLQSGFENPEGLLKGEGLQFKGI